VAAGIFIGDETTAAGFRLGGLEVRITEPAEAGRALTAALEARPPLVVLAAAHAQRIPDDQLEAAQRRITPPVLVVPEAGGQTPAPDLAQQIRSQVGAQQ
jgi:vacuolar-type H+-ATPase subunit F/Vma7